MPESSNEQRAAAPQPTYDADALNQWATDSLIGGRNTLEVFLTSGKATWIRELDHAKAQLQAINAELRRRRIPLRPDDPAEDWAVKPRRVRAVQLTYANLERVRHWIDASGGHVTWMGIDASGHRALALYTCEGEQNAAVGQYVVHAVERPQRFPENRWRVWSPEEFLAEHELKAGEG
uniref:hypothetical protein n=1 Tax=Pseudonocardia sp. CA-138482 TaxID=3240023 RepID=UPI003F499CDA